MLCGLTGFSRTVGPAYGNGPYAYAPRTRMALYAKLGLELADQTVMQRPARSNSLPLRLETRAARHAFEETV